MKLVIQIPCYNEEGTLGTALNCLPRQIEGVDSIEVVIINDGSRDGTVRVARENGVRHIVDLPVNLGLARAFSAGLEYCLGLDADIIVNTDADNQYRADDIPALIKPILEKKADIVIGARPIDSIAHFSGLKKMLEKFGSWVVRQVSETDVEDAPSGFRAFSREAALRVNIYSRYTYTLETLVQAGRKGLVVRSVPIRTNPDLRPSRLVKSIPSYIVRSLITLARIYLAYRPLRFFSLLGLLTAIPGVLLLARWSWFYITRDPGTHVPSLLLAVLFLLLAGGLCVMGLLADLLAVNRQLLEDIQLRVRRMERQKGR